MNISNIELQIEALSNKKYGYGFLNKNEVIKVIKLLQENNIPVSGFDGFSPHPDGRVQIEQDFSRDYSKFSAKEAYDLSLEYFLKDRSIDTLYSISFKGKTRG